MNLDPELLAEFKWLEDTASDEAVPVQEWRDRGNALMEKGASLKGEQLQSFMERFSLLQARESDREKTRILHETLSHAPRRLAQEDSLTETWHMGEFSIRVPKLTPNLGIALYAAASRRREADLSGRCVCGSEGKLRAEFTSSSIPTTA